ncbi:hypothetical protein AAVH_24878 [Aphelenchoides avenae]|nr:hypothetical protein AAVH_24878 [Aphelenchus avenae]
MSPYANLIVSLASIALAITVTSTIVDPSTPVLLQQNVPPPIGQGSLPFALVPPPLGPVLSVFGKLSPQKQEEYQRIIENDTTLTKKQLKDKQAEFVKGLSENIQKAVAEAKADYEKKEADVLVASKKLSAGAQELVGKIKVIYLHSLLDDDSVTRASQNLQLQSLYEGAKKEVLDELRNANIPFPFRPPPGLVGSVIVN